MSVEIDPLKKRVFIWVPGTGGHEPHPAFVDAVNMVVGEEDGQIVHVEYPASWDMEESVPAGVEAFKKLVEEIKPQLVPDFHTVYVGGSSQGAWVISETYKEAEMRDFAHKTVMFGHPGLADEHDHVYDGHDDILEINHPDDAVAFGWEYDRRKMVESFSRAQEGDFMSILFVLWLAVRHPIRLARFIYLIAVQAGLIRWNTSPHDYSQHMPLAVYWLIH